jgi:hypothetical protein
VAVGDPAPRILTLLLEATAQARFDALRSAHFPPDRLLVGAHVTLFHALPAHLAMHPIVHQVASARPFPVAVTGLRLLGRGVAFTLESAPLQQLRRHLHDAWVDSLTPQDRQKWSPHVTIQNKVEPETARALHQSLSATFRPYSIGAVGLGLWTYRNGPWQPAEMFPFQPAAPYIPSARR